MVSEAVVAIQSFLKKSMNDAKHMQIYSVRIQLQMSMEILLFYASGRSRCCSNVNRCRKKKPATVN